MRYTTMVISRSGYVYDLGKTKRTLVTEKSKDGTERQVERVIPLEYPAWKSNGKSVVTENMAALSMCCTQEYCDRIKKMSRADVKKKFKLQ